MTLLWVAGASCNVAALIDAQACAHIVYVYVICMHVCVVHVFIYMCVFYIHVSLCHPMADQNYLEKV